MNAARIFIALGAVFLALGVALGAASTHAAKHLPHPEAARLLQTAVTYQLVHGLGLVIVGALATSAASTWLVASGGLLAAGVLAFCGSLYVLAFTGTSLGLLAPTGGLAFMAGWLCLAIHALIPR